MGVSKVEYGDKTLIDLTEDKVTPETLAFGVTAHDASGEEITGTMNPNGSIGLKYTRLQRIVAGRPIDADEYEVSKGTCTDPEIIIPSYYNGMPVTEIGDFKNLTTVKKVHIPNTVTNILDGFRNCTNLEEVNIPRSVRTLNPFIFEGTALKEVYLSNNISFMGANVFPDNVKIYCEPESKPDGWKDEWASNVDPLNITWGVPMTLSEIDIAIEEVGNRFKWEEIENKPFTDKGLYYLNWNGDTSDCWVRDGYYRISEVVPTKKELSYQNTFSVGDGEALPIKWEYNYQGTGIDRLALQESDGSYFIFAFIVRKINAVYGKPSQSITFPRTGIWLVKKYATQPCKFDIRGLKRFPPHKCVLNAECLPEDETLPTTKKDIFGAIGETYEKSSAAEEIATQSSGVARTAYDVAVEAREAVRKIENTDPKAIIDVAELPTENINENIFYRLLNAQWVVYGEKYNKFKCYCVETRPEVGQPVTLDWERITTYYDKSDGGVYGYIPDWIATQYEEMVEGWHNVDLLFPFVGINYGGVITDIADSVDSGDFKLLLGSTLYTCKDGKWETVKGDGNSGVGSWGEGVEAITFNKKDNEASGSYSVAMGDFTKAQGDNSVAEGECTVATARNQHVQGQFNIEDTEEKYLHIVGNGYDGAPSNAYTLDHEGNGWFAGGVKVGGTGQDDPNAKTLATTEYVDNVATYYSKGLQYTLSDDGTYYTVGAGTCKDVEVVIPSAYKGIPVTTIGQYAFVNCTWIKKVTLPNSITTITGSAFSGCTSLEYINIPKSVTFVGYWAFLNCSSATMYCEADTKPSSGWNSYWNPANRPVVWGCKFTFGELNEKINAAGGGSPSSGGSSNGFEMPQIRFTSATGSTENDTPMLYVDIDNPLKLNVEIVGGGALKVGDQLQVCRRKRFSGSESNGFKRKYKLQRFAEYVITEEDLDKKYLTVEVACEHGHPDKMLHHSYRGLFHDGKAGDIAPLYIRIRRPKWGLHNDDSGQSINADFSNIVTIWKHSIRGTQSIRIQ